MKKWIFIFLGVFLSFGSHLKVQADYQPPAELTISGKVTLTDSFTKKPKAFDANYFKFEIKASESYPSSPMPSSTRASAAADGNFSFGTITFEQAGTYQYIVTQVDLSYESGKTGYHYDFSQYLVTVTVDDSAGSLAATAQYQKIANGQTPSASEILFKSTYTPEPCYIDGENAVSGTVTLTGRELKEDDFTFQLKDSEGTLICETKNDASGHFVFPSFTVTHEGTNTFTVVQKKSSAGGITNDTSVFTVTIDVEDIGGYLVNPEIIFTTSGKVTDKISFHNSYSAKPVKVSILISSSDENTWILKDDKGNVIPGTSTPDGSVYFEFAFDTPGTYPYSLWHKNKKVATILFAVVDDLNGKLQITWELTDLDPEFWDEKNPPSITPSPPSHVAAKTGDSNSWLFFTISGMFSLLIILYYVKKRYQFYSV